jgi:hypothetical protein
MRSVTLSRVTGAAASTLTSIWLDQPFAAFCAQRTVIGAVAALAAGTTASGAISANSAVSESDRRIQNPHRSLRAPMPDGAQSSYITHRTLDDQLSPGHIRPAEIHSRP